MILRSRSSAPNGDDETGPAVGRSQNFLGRLLRDRWADLIREQPSEDDADGSIFRGDSLFQRKVNIILHNPEMFRRYQRYAVSSRHFSPTGLCYVLFDFMDQFMRIADILEDIEREGEQSRYPAVVVSALDDYDTETITFDYESHHELSPHSTKATKYEDFSPAHMISSPTSVLDYSDDSSPAKRLPSFSPTLSGPEHDEHPLGSQDRPGVSIALPSLGMARDL